MSGKWTPASRVGSVPVHRVGAITAGEHENLPAHWCIHFPDHLVGHKSALGEFEQTVMLAILQLGDHAYAPNIAQHLEATIDRSVSRGALYSCLHQLERKGFLRWRVDAPTPERGGHARRFYQVSARGLRALRISREAQLMLWRGLEGILGTTK